MSSATRSKNDPSRPAFHRAWPASGLSWLKAFGKSLRARLAHADPVLLLHPDGSRSTWIGNARAAEPAQGEEPRFVAVEIPDDLVLRRTLVLPKMSQGHIADALLLEVRSNSPFAGEDLAWGYTIHDTEGDQKRVELVMASRRHIAQFIQNRWPELASGPQQPEAWALAGLPAPVVIAGYGEARRLQHAAVQQRWQLALFGVAVALAALCAMTPTAQLRLRAVEAVNAYDAVFLRVAPLVKKRDELALLNDRLRSLDASVADRVDPAGVIEYLTHILPDDTHLYSLDIQKGKITAAGHTVDASALLQKLSSDPRLSNVRSPAAVTRQPGATKEAFVFEFTMDIRQPAVSPVPVAAPVLPAPVVGAPAPAAAVAPGPASPAAPKPGSSPFVIGGSR